VSSQSGYTLPVFACAAAIAALKRLRQPQAVSTVPVDLLDPPETAHIPVEQVAGLPDGGALAIARSDPGEHLDLTRHTPIWAYVTWGSPDQPETILLQGGEGIGKYLDQTGQEQAAIYSYAWRLFDHNLSQGLQPGERLRVTIILPEGRSLAERTSNAAFGVVEGLSLLGTTGIVQPLTTPEQLSQFRDRLRQAAQQTRRLVFCVGENGLDLASQLGIPADCQIKTANWLGPLLVEAGFLGVEAILLLGYHGKLVKLAGGIFHTHHHLADARQEILTAAAVRAGLPLPQLQLLLDSPTVEAALGQLRHLDQTTGNSWVQAVYAAITQQVDRRSQTYIFNHSQTRVCVGSCLFNREREIFATSATGSALLEQVRLA